MFVAALVAAAMNPLAMWVAEARGGVDLGPPTSALLMHYPDFLLVGVAVVISHVVTRLGQQVAKAREMGSYQLGELLGHGGIGPSDPRVRGLDLVGGVLVACSTVPLIGRRRSPLGVFAVTACR